VPSLHEPVPGAAQPKPNVRKSLDTTPEPGGANTDGPQTACIPACRIQQLSNPILLFRTERGIELGRFDDDTNNHTLFIGWHDYMLATGTLPPQAQAFQIWYFALYPDKLNPDVDSTPYERVFPNLKEKSAPERKKMLRDWIASARNDLDLMADPRTDARPLILPAE